ncbi:peptidase [Longimycelium tulufanense]|uniref:Aminopeptidase N n=1 Tax=Longimycelium tulufanense TaxID=907463 RepID=A0A8J3FUA0_9PSEU|nr:M1 family metallopeptidase [Longimycelium tulufanense]GGM49004.1 peptidase [Longimycelium tulufanense]
MLARTTNHALRLLAVLVAALALVATTGAAAPASPTPSGLGDPYLPDDGNVGYEVQHYDIRLRYQPSSDRLDGTTVITAVSTQELPEFSLDFALQASSVQVNGSAVKFFRQQDHKLTAVLPTALAKGDHFTVAVAYADTPSQVVVDGQTAWLHTPDGALAVGQPHIATWWFPSNDHPSNKATFDIAVTVPEGTQVLSNGVLASTDHQEDGWARWHWRSSFPMTTYLVFLAIGNYEINSTVLPDGKPFVTAYSTRLGELADRAKASVERTPEILSFLSERFGPYPFEAAGGVVPAEGIEDSLENQTRPTYRKEYFAEEEDSDIVLHENVHQWFGNAVSVQNWRNIWLNEGFANYAEWLWSEAQGQNSAQQLFDEEYASRPDSDPFWQVAPGDPGKDNLFHDAVYIRGAMALHQLRTTVGDDTFFAILRTWVAEKIYQNATIEEFIAVAERVSGQRLGGLFEDWLFRKAKPSAREHRIGAHVAVSH